MSLQKESLCIFCNFNPLPVYIRTLSKVPSLSALIFACMQNTDNSQYFKILIREDIFDYASERFVIWRFRATSSPPGHTPRQRVGTETLLLPLSRSIPLSSYPVKRTTLGRMEIAANIHVYQQTADN